MMVDLHVTSEGRPHIAVDDEGWHALIGAMDAEVFLMGPVDVYNVRAQPCPCPHGDPPHAAVSLLGFLL